MTIHKFHAAIAAAAFALACATVQAVPTRVSASAGEVRDFLATSSTAMFAATQGGGAFKTTDGGLTWSWVSTLPARYVWKLAQSPAAAARIYAATETGIWKSADTGATWSQITYDPTKAIAVSPGSTAGADTLLAGVSGAGIFKSIDSGATWSRVGGSVFYAASGLDPLHIAYANANSVFAAFYCNAVDFRYSHFQDFGGVFQSGDAGANWNNITTIGAFTLPTKCVTSLAVSNTTAAGAVGVTVLAGTKDNLTTDGRIYRSLNGTDWINPTTPGTGYIFGIQSLSVATGSPNTIWAGTKAFGAWKTTDGGQNWAQQVTLATDPDLVNVTGVGTFSASAVAMIAAKGLGVYRSATGASPWNPPTGLTADRVRALSSHTSAAPNTYYAALDGGGFVKSLDAGANWVQLNGGLNDGNGDMIWPATAVVAHPSSTTTVLGSIRDTNAPGLFSQNTATGNWGAATGNGSQNTNRVYAGNSMTASLHIGPATGTIFYAQFIGGPTGGLVKGASVGALAPTSYPMVVDGNPGFGVAAGAYKIFQAPSNTGLLFLMMYDSLPYRSTDSGLTWNRVAASEATASFMRTAFFDIAEKPGTSGGTLVASTNKGIYISSDFGGNWSRIGAAGLAYMTPSTMVYSANSVLWAADRAGGFYCSTNDGASFAPVSLGSLPPAAFVEARILNGQVHLLTDGAGVYKNSTATCP